MPFATGFAIAYVLSPGVARLESWGSAAAWRASSSSSLFMFGLALILVIPVPLVQGQGVQLIAGVPTLSVRPPGSARQADPSCFRSICRPRMSRRFAICSVPALAEAVTWLAGLEVGMITSSLAILTSCRSSW